MLAEVGTVPRLRGSVMQTFSARPLANATAARRAREASMDNQMEVIGAAHSRSEPYVRSLSWVSQLSALPVIV